MKKKLLLLILILLLCGCTKKYKVTFMDDGKVLSSIEIKKGDNIADYDIPEKDGYIFVSWNKDGFSYDSKTPINDDITLTASWTKEPELIVNHTVTFNYGDEIKTQTVRDGEKALKPEKDPKKEKHDFLGWYVGETLYDFTSSVTKDIVIMAKFEKNRLIITYELDGGSGTTEVEIDKGSIPKRPTNPSKFGYDFVGWTINGISYNFDIPLYTDTIMKANYSPTVFVKVTYDSNGGNGVNSEYLASGSKIGELPIAVKEGFTFSYWSYNGSKFDPNMIINKDIVLVAVYEEDLINNGDNDEDNE